MKKENELQNSHLEHLFDMKLQYLQEAVECAPISMKEGRIIGSGNGVVEGSDIKGTIRWSNYENTLREGVCKLQIPGTIQTNDGEEILFEARGMATFQISQIQINGVLLVFFISILAARSTNG